MRKSDIVIIGAGASGMTAAIAAGRALRRERRKAQITILEKLDSPGHKISATGNGRCNLTNMECEGAQKSREFFRGLGVFTREEEGGRVYPWNGDAKTVTRALVKELERLGVELVTSAEVRAVSSENGGWRIESSKGKWLAKALLLACGGKAAPKLGTTGDGARLARKAGLSVTPLAPALTGIEVSDRVKALKGIRVKGNAKLFYGDHPIGCEEGEIQFTDYGVSGICIFNLSRLMVLPEGKSLKDGFSDYRLVLDTAAGVDTCASDFNDMKESLLPLSSLVKMPLAKEICERADGDVEEIDRVLHAFVLHPKGLRGWDMAQITRGGVAKEEMEEKTLEAKAFPGLFVSGELLDWDGPCGGFNLQHAWETGLKAGAAMAGLVGHIGEQRE